MIRILPFLWHVLLLMCGALVAAQSTTVVSICLTLVFLDSCLKRPRTRRKSSPPAKRGTSAIRGFHFFALRTQRRPRDQSIISRTCAASPRTCRPARAAAYARNTFIYKTTPLPTPLPPPTPQKKHTQNSVWPTHVSLYSLDCSDAACRAASLTTTVVR